jgi:DNA sulfur modification protein DndD
MIALGADTMVDAYDVSIVSGLEGALEHLLDAETCICGTPIEDDERETLERNLAKIQNDEMKTVADLQEKASRHLDCLVEGEPPIEDLAVREAKRKYVSLEGEIDDIDAKISDLEDEADALQDDIDAATVTAEEAEELEATKDALNKEIGGLETTIDDLEDEITELKEEERELEQRSNSMKAANDDEKRFRTLRNLSSKCKEAWENIRDEYVEQKRKSVDDHTSLIFQELTNKDDVYEGLSISEDYELDVKTISGNRDIEEQNPSKGARQIIAYSFIAGLNQFTAREAPVVIDTPIGRLDPEHKKNLINHFPNFRDQVVILYQPGELDEEDVETMHEHTSSHWEIHQREGNPEASTVTQIDSETHLQRVLVE